MYLYNQRRRYPPETRGMAVSALPVIHACSNEGDMRDSGERC